jgi:hypothetical protein
MIFAVARQAIPEGDGGDYENNALSSGCPHCLPPQREKNIPQIGRRSTATNTARTPWHVGAHWVRRKKDPAAEGNKNNRGARTATTMTKHPFSSTRRIRCVRSPPPQRCKPFPPAPPTEPAALPQRKRRPRCPPRRRHRVAPPSPPRLAMGDLFDCDKDRQLRRPSCRGDFGRPSLDHLKVLSPVRPSWRAALSNLHARAH